MQIAWLYLHVNAKGKPIYVHQDLEISAQGPLTLMVCMAPDPLTSRRLSMACCGDTESDKYRRRQAATENMTEE